MNKLLLLAAIFICPLGQALAFGMDDKPIDQNGDGAYQYTEYPAGYKFGQGGDSTHPDGWDGYPGDTPIVLVDLPDGCPPNGGPGGEGFGSGTGGLGGAGFGAGASGGGGGKGGPEGGAGGGGGRGGFGYDDQGRRTFPSYGCPGGPGFGPIGVGGEGGDASVSGKGGKGGNGGDGGPGGPGGDGGDGGDGFVPGKGGTGGKQGPSHPEGAVGEGGDPGKDGTTLSLCSHLGDSYLLGGGLTDSALAPSLAISLGMAGNFVRSGKHPWVAGL